MTGEKNVLLDTYVYANYPTQRIILCLHNNTIMNEKTFEPN